jgi:hypothetical protein
MQTSAMGGRAVAAQHGKHGWAAQVTMWNWIISAVPRKTTSDPAAAVALDKVVACRDSMRWPSVGKSWFLSFISCPELNSTELNWNRNSRGTK